LAATDTSINFMGGYFFTGQKTRDTLGGQPRWQKIAKFI